MAIFRRRFPTRQEIGLVLAVCVAPLHSWAVFVFLKEVPALLLKYPVGEIVAYAAYMQFLALVESMLLLLGLVTVAVLLPRLFRARFVAMASIVVWLSAMWGIADQEGLVTLWRGRSALPWLALWLATVAAALLLVYRSRRVEGWLRSLAERLTVLSSLYVVLGALSFIVVLVRNL